MQMINALVKTQHAPYAISNFSSKL